MVFRNNKCVDRITATSERLRQHWGQPSTFRKPAKGIEGMSMCTEHFYHAGETEFSLGEHPSTDREIKVLLGPYGWYLEMAPPAPESKQEQQEDAADSSGVSKAKRRRKAKAPKPQRVSLGKLPAGQVPEVTLEEAVELLQWPKVFSLCSLTWRCTSLGLLHLAEPLYSP